MKHYFDISKRHIITAAGNNHYKSAVMHPNRIMTEHDFIYMAEGTWKIGQHGEEYELNAGDVLILEANREHYGIEPCSVGAKTIYIHANGLSSDRFFEDALCLESKINTLSSPYVRHYFEKTVYAKQCGEDDLAAICFDILLCELRSCMKNDMNDTLAEKILEYITFADGIPTNYDIAKALNISLKTAEHTFKKAFGRTIHRYILEVKIENAKRYLADFTNMKIYEIADTLGFYDEFHFSRVFKKICGISPKEYRELQKKCTV